MKHTNLLLLNEWLTELHSASNVSDAHAQRGFELMTEIETNPVDLRAFYRSITREKIDPGHVWKLLHSKNVRFNEWDEISVCRAPLWEQWDILVVKAGVLGHWDYGCEPHRTRWFIRAMETQDWHARKTTKAMQRLIEQIKAKPWAWDIAVHMLIWESMTRTAWPNTNVRRALFFLDLPGIPQKNIVDAIVYQVLNIKAQRQGPVVRIDEPPAWTLVRQRFEPYLGKIEEYLAMDEMVHGAQPWHLREARLCKALMELFHHECAPMTPLPGIDVAVSLIV